VHSLADVIRTRIRLAFAAACPEADLFRGFANALIRKGRAHAA
jgi:hypothetical protein